MSGVLEGAVWNSQEVRSNSYSRTFRPLTHVAEVIKREERGLGNLPFEERRAYSDGWVRGLGALNDLFDI